MKNIRPKKDRKPFKLKTKSQGNEIRLNYGKEILYKAPIIPKTIEYKDIDIAFKEFVDKEIDIICDGKLIPTFTLFSNQRFSEYSQTWQHTDENNNLLMNFKTIVRDKNPKMGTNQGNKWIIPGNRHFTVSIRDVLNDNGTECYEILSMKQPYTVDLTYKVSFITNKFENINDFNQKINRLFASRQHYIRPNGHFIPMILEDVSDDSEYNVENRKFYSQSCDIKVMAYIISEDDFIIERKPKRSGLFIEGEDLINKNVIEIEELNINSTENENMTLKEVNLIIKFNPLQLKTKFTIDTDITINSIDVKNVRNYKLWINKTPIYTNKGFKLKEGDEVILRINAIDELVESVITFYGFDENIIQSKELNENVSDENVKNIEIF